MVDWAQNTKNRVVFPETAGCEVEEEENYSLQTEPTWEHKAFSGTDSILCARCKSILREAPEKGAYHQRRDSSKRIEPGKVRFCF